MAWWRLLEEDCLGRGRLPGGGWELGGASLSAASGRWVAGEIRLSPEEREAVRGLIMSMVCKAKSPFTSSSLAPRVRMRSSLAAGGKRAWKCPFAETEAVGGSPQAR